MRCILDAIIEDSADTGENHKIIKSLKTCEVIGLTTGIELLSYKTKRIHGLAFDMPALVLHDKDYPALWIAGTEITESFTEVPTMASPDVKDRYDWVKTMKKADSRQWGALKKCILEAATYYNADYKKVASNPPEYDLVKKNKKSEEYVEYLKAAPNLEFMGLCPNNAYFRIFGSDVQMEAEWVHALSGPALLYKHKFFPLYLVAGFDIMFNNSTMANIRANQMDRNIFGITG